MIFCILMDVMAITGWTDFGIALQPLLVYLGASNAMIGLVSGLAILTLPGIFVSPWITRRFTRKKYYTYFTHIPSLIPILIAGALYFSADAFSFSKPELMKITIVSMIAYQALYGFLIVPHQEYVAACIPMSYRGKLTGYSLTIGAVCGLGSAAAGRWILLHVREPICYGYLFILTGVIVAVGYTVALFAKEVPTPVEESPRPWTKAMIKAAWQDKAFVRFMLFIIVYALTYSPLGGFVAIYGLKGLGMAAASAASFMMISQVIRMAASSPFGILVDRIGAKKIMPYTPLLSAGAFLSVLVLKGPLSVYVAVILLGLYTALNSPAISTLQFGIPSKENRAGHYTIMFIINFIVGSAGNVVVGTAIDMFSYRTVFVAGAIFSCLCFPLIKYLLSVLSDDLNRFD